MGRDRLSCRLIISPLAGMTKVTHLCAHLMAAYPQNTSTERNQLLDSSNRVLVRK